MRKKAIKKLYPGRNKFIKQARKTNNLHEFVGKNGEIQYLNIRKHLFYRKPYKRFEHEQEVFRLFKKSYKEKMAKEKVVKAEEVKQEKNLTENNE